MALDRITMTTPAKGEYAKTVRMTAAALGARLGMSFDGVEDLKLAVEEAFSSAIAFAGEGGEVRLTFTIAEDAIRMDVHLGEADVSEGMGDLADLILEEVCDEHGLGSEGDGECMLFIVKRVETTDGE